MENTNTMDNGLVLLPRRIFLDTNIVQNLATFSSFIYDNYMDEEEYIIFEQLGMKAQADIEALQFVFQLGQRDAFEVAVSPLSLQELSAIPNPAKRWRMMQWAYELLDYWETRLNQYQSARFDGLERIELGIPLSQTGLFNFLPDAMDRILITQSRALRCDAFMTMDRRTIWNFQKMLEKEGIRVISPSEYADLLQPYCGLF